jgi:hypothetical protein
MKKSTLAVTILLTALSTASLFSVAYAEENTTAKTKSCKAHSCKKADCKAASCSHCSGKK